MKEKILAIIKKYNMICAEDTVVCGLSGGADSVFLLLRLLELSKEMGFSMEALHVNHCLRGDESDRDENFCRELCNRLKVPFTAERVDVAGYAAENSLSTEEAARKLRYEIFSRHSAGKKIATAHNADDNLETIILNLTRGTALKGLAGIPPVRGNIVRPILCVSRKEIETFLKSINQSYVTDSTNLSDDYTRNKIRHMIIPVMTEINSSVVSASAKAVGAVRDENDLIESETEKTLSLCRDGNRLTGLNAFHSVIRRRCIARLLSENSLPYSYDRLEEADRILMQGGKINISGDIFLISDKNTIELKKDAPKTEEIFLQKELKIGDNSIFNGKILHCELVLCDNLKKNAFVHNFLTFYEIDYDKIVGSAVIRNRRFGDRIQLSGRNFTSSVKKLINERVPKELRETLHFIEDEQGTVFAEHLGIAQRVAPNDSTKKVLRISIRDN